MPIGLPADADTLRKHTTWFIVYGAVMALLGLFAIAAPNIATLTVTLMVGWLLLLGGGFGLFAVISGGTGGKGDARTIIAKASSSSSGEPEERTR